MYYDYFRYILGCHLQERHFKPKAPTWASCIYRKHPRLVMQKLSSEFEIRIRNCYLAIRQLQRFEVYELRS